MFCKRNIFYVLFVLSTSLCARPDDNLYALQEQIIQEEKAFLGQYEYAVQDMLACASKQGTCDALSKKITFLVPLLPDDKTIYIAGALYVAQVFGSAQDQLVTVLTQIDDMFAYWGIQLRRAQNSPFLSDVYKDKLRLKISELEVIKQTVAGKLGVYLILQRQLSKIQSVPDIQNLFEELQASGVFKNEQQELASGHEVVRIIQLVTNDILVLQASIDQITENMQVPSHFERHKIEYMTLIAATIVVGGLGYVYRDKLTQQLEQGKVAARDFFKKRVERPLYNIYKMVWLQESKEIPVPEFEDIVLDRAHGPADSAPVYASYAWKKIPWTDIFIPVPAAGVDNKQVLNFAREADEVQMFIKNINKLMDSIKAMVPVINETKDKASIAVEIMSLLPALGLGYLGYKTLEISYASLFLQPFAVQPFLHTLLQLHDVCVKNMHTKTIQYEAEGSIWYYTVRLEKLLYALPVVKADQYRHDIEFLRAPDFSYEQKMQIAARMLTLYEV